MPLTFQIKRKSYIFSINDFLALLIIMANYINYYFDTLFPFFSLNRSLFLFAFGIEGSDCVAIKEEIIEIQILIFQITQMIK